MQQAERAIAECKRLRAELQLREEAVAFRENEAAARQADEQLRRDELREREVVVRQRAVGLDTELAERLDDVAAREARVGADVAARLDAVEAREARVKQREREASRMVVEAELIRHEHVETLRSQEVEQLKFELRAARAEAASAAEMHAEELIAVNARNDAAAHELRARAAESDAAARTAFASSSAEHGAMLSSLQARLTSAHEARTELEAANAALEAKARADARLHSDVEKKVIAIESRTDLFLTTFRGMPTANAEGWIGSEGSVGKVSVRRVFKYLQIGARPRRSPSACSEMSKKKKVIAIESRADQYKADVEDIRR